MRLALSPKIAAVLPPAVKHVLHEARKQFWRFWPPRHAFVFGGRATYWADFGRVLYAQEPVFRATVCECERVLLALGGKSLLAHFEGTPDPLFLADEGRLILFCTVIQLALVELWRAYGVAPDAVLGISNGEPAAVYAAGGLTLADALKVSMGWALIGQVASHVYGTLLLNADYVRAKELCIGCRVELAVMMELEPTRHYLLCRLADMADAKAYLRSQGVSAHQLKGPPGLPYHTPALLQHAAVLREPLVGITPRPTTKPCYLTTLGRVLPTGTLLPWDYWLRPPQEPIYQYTTLQAALNDRYFVMTPIGGYPFAYSSQSARKRTLDKVRMAPPFQADVPEAEAFAAIHRQLMNLSLAPRRAGAARKSAEQPPSSPK